MPRQLSDWDHIGRLLQLDRLLVDEMALVVNDRVRVERALVGAAGWVRAGMRASARAHIYRNVATHASHRLGRPLPSPPIPPVWCTTRVLRQLRHMSAKEVARDDSADALMTIPGRRTSLVRVLAWTSFRISIDRSSIARTHGQVPELEHIHPAPQSHLDLGHLVVQHARLVGRVPPRNGVDDLLGEAEEGGLELCRAC